jgi:hypothetical protein
MSKGEKNTKRSIKLRPAGSIYGAILIFNVLSSLMANPVVAAPQIACDVSKYDFGTLMGREKITHEFILRNKGNEPVLISKIKNCCGVESVMTPRIILPGSNAVCTAVFTSKNRYGPQDKQILIATNDRNRPYFELRITGTLLRPVGFSPRLVRLGNLLPDSRIEQTITVTNLLEGVVLFDSVSSTIPGIKAHVIESNPRNWIIGLASSGPLDRGTINGRIELDFSTGRVSVPVVGIIKPFIQVVPECIQLNSGPTKEVERLIMLRSGDGRAFDILSAEWVRTEGQVTFSKRAAGRWQIKVIISPASIEPGSVLQIETSCAGQRTVVVPLETIKTP